MKNDKKQLSEDQAAMLLETLKARFEKNKNRHKGIDWVKVQEKLEASPEKLWILDEMEVTGGEPDVIGYDQKAGHYIFCDCATESPKERRSLCYDRAAWEARKANKPENTAMDVAAEMGIEILNEEQYNELQQLGEFDLKTSSWLQTPANVRKLGGAIFGDRRFGRVFIYHNGADSYYAARGFRGLLKV
ncbi:DUF4256 domain-containing protein [Dyadobacter aurulentus]|uniref:DUF4256 domain-containing protein n=1 Tax=Dyadobacter sp. UC 10 TaxID=2605428 RepID=UPI0011F15B50|nr:DUF4256 domain-containing protein [Dyadobacter sp. UC 10]KAA0993469.1 DUF4256 domain-containing protein [Dyadobacter sp. UC 10]